MESARGLGLDYLVMPSGAGHDTSQISQITRTGMVFVSSEGGRSHCPDESTKWEHIAMGAEVMASVLLALDEEQEIEK